MQLTSDSSHVPTRRTENAFERKLGECNSFRSLRYLWGSLCPRCKARKLSRNRFCIRERLSATFFLSIRTLLSISLSLTHTHARTHALKRIKRFSPSQRLLFTPSLRYFPTQISNSTLFQPLLSLHG